MGRVIAVANQKGGVGKSTTAINLSACLAEKEKKVLTIDMDPQGNTTSGLGVDKNNVENTLYELLLGEAETKDTIVKDVVENVDLIPSNVNLSGAEIELIGVDEKEYILKKIIDKVRRKYDYIIIDCPPSLNMLTINALTAANSVLVPIQCEYYALEGLSQLIHTIDLVKDRLNKKLVMEGVVFTMYDARTNLGQYRRLKGVWENGVLTGKGMSYGGSLIRPEATGYGAVYYLQEVLKHENDTIEGKRLAISGYGNVGWGIMKKAAELGAKVTYFAGPDGYIHDPDGVTGEKLDYILEMRAKDPMHCKPYADKYGVEFVAGEKCWGVKDVDVYMPAATQNDVRMESAEKIAASGVKYYIEVANMPTTNDALNFLRAQKHMVVAPSKAVNAGGVGVSGLEMSQNSERLSWTAEEVDAQLHKMMKNIHKVSAEAAEEYGLGYDLVAGANIAGFKKVAEAMYEQGVF